MKHFTLQLLDATRTKQIEHVTSFIGEDASGSFGILASHADLMTALIFGLARFRCGEAPWQYLALPGAILYFKENTLSISTRRYLIDENYERISTDLKEQLLTEEAELHVMKQNIHQLEENILRRLWEMGRKR